MRTVVVGGGPVGMFCGMVLARRGDEVVLVDRDPGPPPAGEWARAGVMQFRHPHGFRHIVREALTDLLPDVWDAVLAAGGLAAKPPGMPAELTGLQCRRSTFERAVWQSAAREPGLALLTGHAERIEVRQGRAVGVVVDGGLVEADRVIVAAGRTARIGADARPAGEGGSCGFAYVARMYRARQGVDVPVTGLPMAEQYRGYQAMVFPQDAGTLSALIVRPNADAALAGLRHDASFQAAAQLIPQLAPWTDEDRFEPITGAMAGGNLTNSYRGQAGQDGRAGLPGVYFVGDTVCTTNPAAGRGISLGLRQARELLRLLGEAGAADAAQVAGQFDIWCSEHIKPWYDDHVYWDATLLRRLKGEDIDIEARIPSDVVCAAAERDPAIWAAAAPYLSMQAPPTILDSVQDLARDVLRSGWRPSFASGPSRDELAELVMLQPAA